MTEDKEPILKQVGGAIGFWLGLFGVAFGAISAASAIVRVFSVGLTAMLAELISFYRRALTPLYELVNLPPWPFQIPKLAVDLFALYIVLFAMSWRSHESNRKVKNEVSSSEGDVTNFSLRSIAHFIFLVPVFTATPVRRYVSFYFGQRRSRLGQFEFWQRYYRLVRYDAIAYVALPLGVVVFFLTNAFASG
ncbi:MAG: hypothetical protein ACT4OF_08955 [Caulobacteraceae bacterium]